MNNCKFATCINCIDGRVQEPLIAFFKKQFQVDCIDLVTEPGPDAILANYSDKLIISSIKKRVNISIKKHKSKIVGLAGHYDCAANPVGKKEHIAQIKEAKRKISSWDKNVSFLGLWINKKFKVEVVCSSV